MNYKKVQGRAVKGGISQSVNHRCRGQVALRLLSEERRSGQGRGGGGAAGGSELAAANQQHCEHWGRAHANGIGFATQISYVVAQFVKT